MNFQTNKANLDNILQLLKVQSEETSESWNDSVQRRFYEQFIHSLPRELSTFQVELAKLDACFEKIEEIIQHL
jgi:hypothetical protein